jgi:Carboxypeptidase regulatory-like domain
VNKLSVLLSLLALLILSPAQAQRFAVQVSGKVTDHFTGDPVKGVLVRMLKAGRTEAETTTRGDGGYEFTLERGWRYVVFFSKAGLVAKHVTIDTEEIPAYPDVPYFEMDIQMTLFPWIADFDFAVFDQALGEAGYKESVRNMSWDIEYTERMRPVLSKTMDEYEKTWKGYYKRKKPEKKTGAATVIVPSAEAETPAVKP